MLDNYFERYVTKAMRIICKGCNRLVETNRPVGMFEVFICRECIVGRGNGWDQKKDYFSPYYNREYSMEEGRV